MLIEEKLTGKLEGTISGATPPIISVNVPTKTPDKPNNPGAKTETARKIKITYIKT